VGIEAAGNLMKGLACFEGGPFPLQIAGKQCLRTNLRLLR
jgi:hypothetical protein